MSKLLHPERLEGVDARLAAVIRDAVLNLSFDCTIAEGKRSAETCYQNWGKGRTAQQCAQQGIARSYAQPAAAKVTWVASPLDTKHYRGLAIDIYPLIDGKLDSGAGPQRMERFDALYHAVMASAARAKVRVRYGGDWDQDGKLRERGETDSPHFEVVA